MLLFSRSSREEEACKHVRGSRRVFELERRRIRRIVHLLGVELIETPRQQGHTFGERFRHAFEDVRSRGYGRIVAIPIDVPGLTARDLRNAFDLLETHEHVFGPSPDGGAWLIGTRADSGDLLDGIRWNTSFVLADLRARTSSAAMLRMLHDLDGRDALGALIAETSDPALRAALASLLIAPFAQTQSFASALVSPLAAQGRAPPIRH